MDDGWWIMFLARGRDFYNYLWFRHISFARSHARIPTNKRATSSQRREARQRLSRALVLAARRQLTAWQHLDDLGLQSLNDRMISRAAVQPKCRGLLLFSNFKLHSDAHNHDRTQKGVTPEAVEHRLFPLMHPSNPKHTPSFSPNNPCSHQASAIQSHEVHPHAEIE